MTLQCSSQCNFKKPMKNGKSLLANVIITNAVETHAICYFTFIFYIFNIIFQVYLFNSFNNSLFTIVGFALPLDFFMTCPTKNPNALSFPCLKSSID